jgi:hypothetical protein
MIVVLTNLRGGKALADPAVSQSSLPEEKPQRQWSASQLAAVVQAAYIREALGQ